MDMDNAWILEIADLSLDEPELEAILFDLEGNARIWFYNYLCSILRIFVRIIFEHLFIYLNCFLNICKEIIFLFFYYFVMPCSCGTRVLVCGIVVSRVSLYHIPVAVFMSVLLRVRSCNDWEVVMAVQILNVLQSKRVTGRHWGRGKGLLGEVTQWRRLIECYNQGQTLSFW